MLCDLFKTCFFKGIFINLREEQEFVEKMFAKVWFGEGKFKSRKVQAALHGEGEGSETLVSMMKAKQHRFECHRSCKQS